MKAIEHIPVKAVLNPMHQKKTPREEGHTAARSTVVKLDLPLDELVESEDDLVESGYMVLTFKL